MAKALSAHPRALEAARGALLATHAAAGLSGGACEARRLLHVAEGLCRAAIAVLATAAPVSPAAVPAKPKRRRKPKDKGQDEEKDQGGECGGGKQVPPIALPAAAAAGSVADEVVALRSGGAPGGPAPATSAIAEGRGMCIEAVDGDRPVELLQLLVGRDDGGSAAGSVSASAAPAAEASWAGSLAEGVTAEGITELRRRAAQVGPEAIAATEGLLELKGLGKGMGEEDVGEGMDAKVKKGKKKGKH